MDKICCVGGKIRWFRFVGAWAFQEKVNYKDSKFTWVSIPLYNQIMLNAFLSKGHTLCWQPTFYEFKHFTDISSKGSWTRQVWMNEVSSLSFHFYILKLRHSLKLSALKNFKKFKEKEENWRKKVLWRNFVMIFNNFFKVLSKRY